jgi:hypothetical protein
MQASKLACNQHKAGEQSQQLDVHVSQLQVCNQLQIVPCKDAVVA